MDLKEVTLTEVLQAAGYRTGLFGKWHLGAAASHGPTKQGFDEFFVLRGEFIDNYNHYFLHGQDEMVALARRNRHEGIHGS